MLRVVHMEHAFSVEMKSKTYIKNISISNESHNCVLFEGSLGELTKISLAEGDVLEIIGVDGTLRVDLSEEQLKEALEAYTQVNPQLRVGEKERTD
jgi:hypothetical protein